jgi:hypothetical protein
MPAFKGKEKLTKITEPGRVKLNINLYNSHQKYSKEFKR